MGERRRQLLDLAAVVAGAVAVERRSSRRWGCPRPRCSPVCSRAWCGPSRSRAGSPSRGSPPTAGAGRARRLDGLAHRPGDPARRSPPTGCPSSLVTVATLALSLGAGLAAAAAARDQPGDRGVLDDRRRRLRDHRDGPRPRRRRAHGRRPAVPAGAADRRPHAGRGDRGLRRLDRGRRPGRRPTTGPAGRPGCCSPSAARWSGLVVGRLAAAAGGRPARPAGRGRRRRPHRARSRARRCPASSRAPRSW